jgi:hypothetical protein
MLKWPKCRLTVEKKLLVEIGTENDVTELQFETVKVPLVCILEDEELEETSRLKTTSKMQ